MEKYDYVRKTTKNILNKYKTRCPFKIAEEKNIKIITLNNDVKLLGMYTVIKRNKFIFLNTNLNEFTQRMVMAHELGHAVLHSEILKNKQPIYEYDFFGTNLITEYEANLFASLLLIDENDIVELLECEYTSGMIANALCLDINLLQFKLIEMKKEGYDINITDCPDSLFFRKMCY